VPLAQDRSDFAGEQLADDDPSPSQVMLQHERQLQISDAIARLSEDYQEVIVLRNLQQLPFDQIAQRMGRSRPAVQMLWMRAVQKLQDELRAVDNTGSVEFRTGQADG
jgi:RNA polymerase sigma-70 factor (ECF subfamily)